MWKANLLHVEWWKMSASPIWAETATISGRLLIVSTRTPSSFFLSSAVKTKMEGTPRASDPAIAYGWLLVAAFFHSSSSLDGRSHIIKRWGLCGLLGCPHINVLMIYDWSRQQKDIKQAEQKISSFCFIPSNFFVGGSLSDPKKGCTEKFEDFFNWYTIHLIRSRRIKLAPDTTWTNVQLFQRILIHGQKATAKRFSPLATSLSKPWNIVQHSHRYPSTILKYRVLSGNVGGTSGQ